MRAVGLVFVLTCLTASGCAESVADGPELVDTGGSVGDGGGVDSSIAKPDTGSSTTDSGGLKDSSAVDTGTPDTGSADTGDPDTGDPDTGDFPDFGTTDSGSSTGDGGGAGEAGAFAPGMATCSTDPECGEGACCTKAHTCGVMFAGDCVAF